MQKVINWEALVAMRLKEVSERPYNTAPYVGSRPKRCAFPESRALLRRLGLTFFLFGLINNGTLNSQLLCLCLTPHSALCHHPLRRTRPGPALHAQRHHRLLQHLPLHARQARVAIPPPRTRTVRQTTRRLRNHQHPGHVGKSNALRSGRCPLGS